MKTTFIAVLLCLGVSAAVAAPATAPARLAETDARELAYVVQTLEQARRCGIAPASFAAMSRFLELSRDMQVRTNKVPAPEVDAVIARARTASKPLDAAQCKQVFKDLPAANASFANLNKTLESLNEFEASLKK